ncbi:UPF0235 protein C15orf40 homolog [Condylostylus longicornis]|uniref:UPF0235 protein C15orf40 homolog n=1 Tax=Condylostylus longicornis TaxID=2530218 RepID=UPI00244DA683|nr:UPF0235 protein C15orf40 homolog [Condylostylus longicornis]
MRKIVYIANTMSKSKKSSKKLDIPQTVGISKTEPIQMDKQGNIVIKILAKPGAKQNSITNISDEGVGVQISAPPVEGEANTELVKYLSSILGLRKSDVTLDKGSKSRQKTILIFKGITTVDNVKTCLQKECG